MLLAAVVQLVFGWTKSFPVSIGRPGMRTVGQVIEIAVLVPLVLILGDCYGATGAAAALSSRRQRWRLLAGRPGAASQHASERRGKPRMKLLVVSGIWPPDVGGPASHAPEVAGWLRGARPRGRGRRDRRPAPGARGVSRRAGCRARCPRGVRHARVLRSSRRARGARTSSIRPACSGARRSARCSRGRRSCSSSPPTRRSSAHGAAGLADGDVTQFQQAARAARRAVPGAANGAVRRAAHVVCPSAFIARSRRLLGRPR